MKYSILIKILVVLSTTLMLGVNNCGSGLDTSRLELPADALSTGLAKFSVSDPEKIVKDFAKIDSGMSVSTDNFVINQKTDAEALLDELSSGPRIIYLHLSAQQDERESVLKTVKALMERAEIKKSPYAIKYLDIQALNKEIGTLALSDQMARDYYESAAQKINAKVTDKTAVVIRSDDLLANMPVKDLLQKLSTPKIILLSKQPFKSGDVATTKEYRPTGLNAGQVYVLVNERLKRSQGLKDSPQLDAVSLKVTRIIAALKPFGTLNDVEESLKSIESIVENKTLPATYNDDISKALAFRFKVGTQFLVEKNVETTTLQNINDLTARDRLAFDPNYAKAQQFVDDIRAAAGPMAGLASAEDVRLLGQRVNGNMIRMTADLTRVIGDERKKITDNTDAQALQTRENLSNTIEEARNYITRNTTARSEAIRRAVNTGRAELIANINDNTNAQALQTRNELPNAVNAVRAQIVADINNNTNAQAQQTRDAVGNAIVQIPVGINANINQRAGEISQTINDHTDGKAAQITRDVKADTRQRITAAIGNIDDNTRIRVQATEDVLRRNYNEGLRVTEDAINRNIRERVDALPGVINGYTREQITAAQNAITGSITQENQRAIAAINQNIGDKIDDTQEAITGGIQLRIGQAQDAIVENVRTAKNEINANTTNRTDEARQVLNQAIQQQTTNTVQRVNDNLNDQMGLAQAAINRNTNGQINLVRKSINRNTDSEIRQAINTLRQNTDTRTAEVMTSVNDARTQVITDVNAHTDQKTADAITIIRDVGAETTRTMGEEAQGARTAITRVIKNEVDSAINDINQNSNLNSTRVTRQIKGTEAQLATAQNNLATTVARQIADAQGAVSRVVTDGLNTTQQGINTHTNQKIAEAQAAITAENSRQVRNVIEAVNTNTNEQLLAAQGTITGNVEQQVGAAQNSILDGIRTARTNINQHTENRMNVTKKELDASMQQEFRAATQQVNNNTDLQMGIARARIVQNTNEQIASTERNILKDTRQRITEATTQINKNTNNRNEEAKAAIKASQDKITDVNARLDERADRLDQSAHGISQDLVNQNNRFDEIIAAVGNIRKQIADTRADATENVDNLLTGMKTLKSTLESQAKSIDTKVEDSVGRLRWLRKRLINFQKGVQDFQTQTKLEKDGFEKKLLEDVASLAKSMGEKTVDLTRKLATHIDRNLMITSFRSSFDLIARQQLVMFKTVEYNAERAAAIEQAAGQAAAYTRAGKTEKEALEAAAKTYLQIRGIAYDGAAVDPKTEPEKAADLAIRGAILTSNLGTADLEEIKDAPSVEILEN